MVEFLRGAKSGCCAAGQTTKNDGLPYGTLKFRTASADISSNAHSEREENRMASSYVPLLLYMNRRRQRKMLP